MGKYGSVVDCKLKMHGEGIMGRSLYTVVCKQC